MSTSSSLAAEFQPTGHHPEWWPVDVMRSITPCPVDWVGIVELTPGPASEVRRCVLIPIEDVQDELARPRSVASEVGQVEVFDGKFHDGLTDPFGGRAEFFCQVRWQEPATEPAVEWALPFLWYWRAIRQGNQWTYLDSAGRDVELARVRMTAPDDYVVEVRALALRHYLHLRDKAMLLDVQVDQDHPDTTELEREEHPLACDWASMEFQIYDYDGSRTDGRTVAASSLHGQYVILPADAAPGPAWCTVEEPAAYPEFIYSLDPSTGRPLTVQPTVENAGTDGNPGPHFCTPIYFDPQVLNRYLAEPRRYTVTGSRISCLPVWTLSIGRTSDNLIEVDLYDLSRMPWREWDHWRAHNVPASGGDPDEGKFRRERLNQVASSPDIVRDLRTALRRANDTSLSRLAWPIWRPLAEPTATEWAALHPPVVKDRIALQGPLLTLSKVLVDSIDSTRLRVLLTQTPPDAKSLTLLQQYVDELGGPNDAVQALRDLQDLRSQGGFAHYGGSAAERTLTRAADGATTPAEIFENICLKLIGAVDKVATTLSVGTASGT